MTALFGDVIFGPVRSRRLGVSLGVNLLPLQSKLCNFNCIYCECGWTDRTDGGGKFNSREVVGEELEKKLRSMALAGECPDTITFAGNGEPTTHPDFEAIVDDTLRLRDEICPGAKVSVLSNATMIHREEVRRALLRVDNNILKLDSAIDATVRRINDPRGAYSVRRTIELMKLFDGRLTIQTMFLRGTYNNDRVDNTTPEEVAAWLAALREIRPRDVMVYTIDRDTPAPNLQKVSEEELTKLKSLYEKDSLTS